MTHIVTDRDTQIESDSRRLLGNLYGAYHDRRVFSPEEVLDALRATPAEETEAVDLLRHSVGNFSYVVQTPDTIHIYTSPRTLGIFVYRDQDRIHLFDDEREAYEFALRRDDFEINDYEVIDVFLQEWSCNSPFQSLCASISRIPGGCVAEIPKESARNAKCRSYFVQSPDECREKVMNDDEERTYEEFVDRLEGTMRVYQRAFPKIKIMFSGGIDSSAVAIAAQRIGCDVELIGATQNGTKGTYDCFGEWSAIEQIGALLGMKTRVLHCNKFDPELRDLRQRCIRHGYMNMCLWDSWIVLDVLRTVGREDPDAVVLTGEYIDTGYGIGHTKEATICHSARLRQLRNEIFSRYYRIWKSIPSFKQRLKYLPDYWRLYRNELHRDRELRRHHHRCRLRYTRFYQQGLANEVPRWSQYVAKERHNHSSSTQYSKSFEYIFSTMVFGYVEQEFQPFISDRILPAALQPVQADYVRYKKETFLDRLFSPEAQQSLRDDTLDSTSLNYAFRLANFYLSLSSMPRSYDNLDGPTNVCRVPLVFEGPMIDFFLNFRYGAESEGTPKSFLYRYFYEHTRQDFLSVRRKIQDAARGNELQRITSPVGHHEPLNACANTFRHLTNRVETADVLARLFSQPFCILKYARPDSLARRALAGILYEVEHGVGDIPYQKFMALYNLELHLRYLQEAVHSDQPDRTDQPHARVRAARAGMPARSIG